MDAKVEQCPWCGSSVSRTKFLEIETRIRDEERKRLAEAEAAMKKRLEEKFARDLDAQKQSVQKQVQADADKRLASVVGERDTLAAKIKQLEGREETILKQAQEDAERRSKILLEQAERQREKELKGVREVLEKDRDKQLLKKDAEFSREREKYQKKTQELERQLQRKTANELGDGAEIDLFEALREAFPGDHFERVDKGQPGADIHHEVLHKGVVCGRIVYDSKNRQAWKSSFATKLREDQLAAKADHAILSTTVFPKEQKELCIQSDVIVVSPARVVHIVEMLRSFIVKMHVLGLSTQERAGKMSRLYKYITSENYTQRLNEATSLTEDILEVDVQEQNDHRNVWKKRGLLTTRLKNTLHDMDSEISAIIEGTDDADLEMRELPSKAARRVRGQAVRSLTG